MEVLNLAYKSKKFLTSLLSSIAEVPKIDVVQFDDSLLEMFSQPNLEFSFDESLLKEADELLEYFTNDDDVSQMLTVNFDLGYILQQNDIGSSKVIRRNGETRIFIYAFKSEFLQSYQEFNSNSQCHT